MTDSEHVTIREAARRYWVSDKKLQRAIRAEKLPARYPKPNRCEIAVADLLGYVVNDLSVWSARSSGKDRCASSQQELEQVVRECVDHPAAGKTDGSRELVILAKDRRIKELEAENRTLQQQLKVAAGKACDRL